MGLKLNFHLDNLNNLYFTSLEQVAEDTGYDYDADNQRLSLPSIINTENGLIYNTYSIHDCAFYGLVLPNLNKVRIRQCVLNIGNYVFTKSNIHTLEIFSVIPPTFAPKAFEGWPQKNGEQQKPFKIECCKGLSPIFEAVLQKFINSGQVEVVENDYVLETRNYIPYLDYAGDALEAIEYQAELVEIKPTAYLGHRFTTTPTDSNATKMQFLQPDDIHGTVPLNQSYYKQIELSNFYFLQSLTENRPGIVAFGAGQIGAKEMPSAQINQNILKNGLYNANYADGHIIKFNGEYLEDFALQQNQADKINVSIQINFNTLKGMSSNVFRGMKLTSVKPLEAQNEVSGACYRAILFNSGNSVVSLTSTSNSADYIVHYNDKCEIDEIVWARRGLTLGQIKTMLTATTFKQIKVIPSYCFSLSEKESNRQRITLTVPDNIEYIGTHAFENYTINILQLSTERLKKITIEDYAFINSDLDTIIGNNKYMDYTLLIDGTNQEKTTASNALTYSEFKEIMQSASQAETMVVLSNRTIQTMPSNLQVLTLVGKGGTKRTILSQLDESYLQLMPPLVLQNFEQIRLSGLFASVVVADSVNTVTLSDAQIYGSKSEANRTIAKRLDSYTSGLSIKTINTHVTNVKTYGFNQIVGNLGGDGIRTVGAGKVSFTGDGELFCLGNAGCENDGINRESKHEISNPLAPASIDSYITSGGCGIGYSYNGDLEYDCAEIEINGLSKVWALGYGQQAFGIGGSKANITINNTTIEQAFGGFSAQGGSEFFGPDKSYGKQESEGGCAIGTNTVGYLDYQGTVTIKNTSLKNIEGGSKAAGIGGCYWSSVKINIEDSHISAVYGGNASAAIGGSRVRQTNPGDQKIEINIANTTIDLAQGGIYAAGIGSGYDVLLSSTPCQCIIDISDNTSLTVKGGARGAGIGSGYHTAHIAGNIDNSVNITNVEPGASYKPDKYTAPQAIGYGVLDPTREGAILSGTTMLMKVHGELIPNPVSV